MPIDPQVSEYIRGRAARRPDSPAGLSDLETRRHMSAAMAAGGPREAVPRVTDRTIPGPYGEIPIRIYQPDGDGPFPIYVNYHGGGWVVGNLDTSDQQCRQIGNRANCVVVSVDYRLAPEYKFPIPAEECYAATVWVAENAASLKGDPDRIAVGGHSAGGNLAAVVPIMARDRKGPKIVQQILMCPVTEHAYETDSYRENEDGHGVSLTKASMVWFWDHYLDQADDDQNPYAAPLRASDLTGLPPALIIVGALDPLRDEGEAYGAKLWEAGVSAVVMRYVGIPHSVISDTFQGQHAINTIAATLRTAFTPAKVPVTA